MLGIVLGLAAVAIAVEVIIGVRVLMKQHGPESGGDEPATVAATETAERAPRTRESTGHTYDPVAHDIVLMFNEFLPQLGPVYMAFDHRRMEAAWLSGCAIEERDTDRKLKLGNELLEAMERWPSDWENVLQVTRAYDPFTDELSLVHGRLLEAFGWTSRVISAVIEGRNAAAADAIDNCNEGLVDWVSKLQRLAQQHGLGELVSLERLATRFDEIGPGGWSPTLALLFLTEEWPPADEDAICDLGSGYRVVIPPRFYQAFGFSDGRAIVSVSAERYAPRGYIDKSGAVVIKPIYPNALSFSHGLACVRVDTGLCGFIDRTGNMVIEPRFCAWSSFDEPDLGRAHVNCTVERPFGWNVLINRSGRQIRLLEYLEVSPFSEGLALVATAKWGDSARRCGFIDRKGNVVIPLQYEDASEFSGGLAAVQVDGKWGFIDKRGKMVIQPRFTGDVWPFRENLAAVMLDEANGVRWGFIDREGELVIELRGFRHFIGFREGRALVTNLRTGMKGFIDKTGKFVIPARFYDAGSFFEGLAPVQVEKDGKRGYINRQGEIVILPQFDGAGSFSEGMASFTLGGRTGYIAKTK